MSSWPAPRHTPESGKRRAGSCKMRHRMDLRGQKTGNTSQMRVDTLLHQTRHGKGILHVCGR